jgi:hypothetical protein
VSVYVSGSYFRQVNRYSDGFREICDFRDCYRLAMLSNSRLSVLRKLVKESYMASKFAKGNQDGLISFCFLKSASEIQQVLGNWS